MRIVLDTNVIISAFVFGGNSAKVLEKCILKHDLYISDWILNETSRVLNKKLKTSPGIVSKISQIIQSEFSLVNPGIKLPTICRDKDDNHILQLAESIKAKYIITGDNDLLVLKIYKKIQILSPKEFLQNYQ